MHQLVNTQYVSVSSLVHCTFIDCTKNIFQFEIIGRTQRIIFFSIHPHYNFWSICSPRHHFINWTSFGETKLNVSQRLHDIHAYWFVCPCIASKRIVRYDDTQCHLIGVWNRPILSHVERKHIWIYRHSVHKIMCCSLPLIDSHHQLWYGAQSFYIDIFEFVIESFPN